MRLLNPALAGHAATAPPTRVFGGESPSIEWGRLICLVIVLAFGAAPFVGFLTSLAVLTVMGFGLAFFGFSRPWLGALGISLLCTLDPLMRHFLLTTGGLLRWNTFNYWLLIVMAVSAAFVWRVADPHSKLLKLLAVLLVANLVVSPSLEMGVQHILGMVTMFGVLVYFAQARNDEGLWYMVGVVNGLAGAAGGLAYLQLKDTLPEMNENAWALFPGAAVFAICLGFRAAATRPNGQLILGVLAALNTLWTFLSGSRGGILICAVGLIFIVVTMRRGSHRMVLLSSSVVLTAVVLNAFNDMQNTTMHRINKMLDEERSTVSRTNGRSDLAIAGLHMFREHPFGVGTGGFAHAWAELGFVPGLTSFKRGEEFQAHSAWIKVLAESGWPGTLVMVIYVLSFAWYGRRSGQEGGTALGIFVTASITVTFLSTEFQGKSVWMLAAGATAQFHPAEMARCISAEVRRFAGPARRTLWAGIDPDMPPTSPSPAMSTASLDPAR